MLVSVVQQCESVISIHMSPPPWTSLSPLTPSHSSRLLQSTSLSSLYYTASSHCCCSVVFNSLWPHGLQHTRLPCPSLSPWVCSNSCPLCRWCHPTILFSVAPLSSCPQSSPTSGSFPMSWLIASGGQSIGTSVSVLPMNIQGGFPSGLTSLISLLSKGLSRVFSSTTVWKNQFFDALPISYLFYIW